MEEAVQQDREQKLERKEATNASKKRKAMDVHPGDTVILKRYPKGSKFDPIYEDQAYEVVSVEDKGVIVRDQSGKTKRRHKDDIKHFHHITQSEDDPTEEATQVVEINTNNEEADSLAEAGAALEEMHPVGNANQEQGTAGLDRREGVTPDAIPAGRPQRQRLTPRHLKDYVLKRIRVMKGGE